MKIRFDPSIDYDAVDVITKEPIERIDRPPDEEKARVKWRSQSRRAERMNKAQALESEESGEP